MFHQINEQALLERKLFDGMAAARKEQLRKLINRLASYKSKNGGAGLTANKKAELAKEFASFLNDIPDAQDLQKIKNTITWLGGNASAAPASAPAVQPASTITPADPDTEVTEVPTTSEIQDDQEEQQVATGNADGNATSSSENKPNPYAKWDLGLKSPREILADLNKPKATAKDVFDSFVEKCASNSRLRLMGLSSDFIRQAAQEQKGVYIIPLCVVDTNELDDDFSIDDIKVYISKMFAKAIKETQKEYALTDSTPFAVSVVHNDASETLMAIVFDARNY